MLISLRLLLILCALFLPTTINALDDLAASNEPVEVSADRLEASELAGSLVFIGNAEARQGNLTIYADRLTVHYLEKQREVERVVAQGNVRIVQLDRVATGERAEFFRLESRVELSGQPRVSENGSFVEGHLITLLLNEKRSVVTGGQGGRVNAVFKPKAEESP